ncbi:MAG TPA: hypothetical protein PLW14_11890 [Chlorobiota bacterium]|nr:hypothetical protein [Chlorobiota bacterium]
MNRIDIQLLLYEEQIKHKSEIESQIRFPISAIVLLVASVAYVLEKTSAITTMLSVGAWFFVGEAILFLVSGLGILNTLYYLSKAYNRHFTGFEYAYLPLARDIYEDGAINEEGSMDEYFEHRLAEVSTINARINEFRSGQLHKAKVRLIATMTTIVVFEVLLIVAFILKGVNNVGV